MSNRARTFKETLPSTGYVNTTNATALVASVHSRTTTECYEGIFATGIGARFRMEIRLPCSKNSRQSRTSMFFN